ncbi:MAG: hypothetical protein AAFY15_17005, partial [Cyanobacteria bacterium J06648_11]
PVQFRKAGGRSKARLGLVEYLGPPRILKKDVSEEMVLCTYNEYEILNILARQSKFVRVRGADNA